MRRTCLFSLLLILFPPVHGGTGLQQDSSSVGDLSLRFRNINFVRNNEYSNPIIEGYTLIGYFIQPELVYFPSEKVTLQLGAHLLQYSGTNKFNLIKPVFTTSYSFSDHLVFTMGTLQGSDRHRMFDPHFNSEKLYNAFSEDGFELLFSNGSFFNDAWISWENFIFKGGNEREIFTAGESFSYKSGKISDLFRITIPLQIQFRHYGGQISNYTEHVETYFNLAAGGKLSFDINGGKCGEAGAEGLFFISRTLTENAPSGINKGYGLWFKLFYETRYGGLDAGFWQSHDFFAPQGNFIFSSVSDVRKNLTIDDRKLITCSGYLRLFHKSFLEFFLGLEGFYDPDLGRFDNAATLHLRFDKLIRLATLKSR